MSDVKWTKGPWIVGKGAGYFLKRPDAEARRESALAVGMSPAVTLVCEPGWFDDGEAKANAHLIAAAPDLYAALELDRALFNDFLMAKFSNDGLPRLIRERIAVIDAALAKARGEA